MREIEETSSVPLRTLFSFFGLVESETRRDENEFNDGIMPFFFLPYVAMMDDRCLRDSEWYQSGTCNGRKLQFAKSEFVRLIDERLVSMVRESGPSAVKVLPPTNLT